MKKTFKTLALAGALVLSSVGLVACGGDDKALVDVQGNYVAASETKVNVDEYFAKLDNEPKGQNYKISMKMSMESSDAGTTSSVTMKGVGHVSEVDGFDISFDASVKMEGEGVSINQKAEGKIYYDIAESRVYASTNESGETVKFYTDVKDGAGVGDAVNLPLDEGYFTVNGVKDAITALGLDAEVSVCETEDNVKIKYTGENGTFYIVFDTQGEFVGARCEFTVAMSTGDGDSTISVAIPTMSVVTEVVRTNEKVAKLSDAEKAQYSPKSQIKMGA